MTPRAPRSWARRLGLGALGVLLLASCSQKPVSVPLRSLERSGKMTLLCLDLGSTDQTGYSLEDCQARKLATKPGGTKGEVHLFALVNQTTRGEVALLDIAGTAVLDTDASRPGYNFLPVGAQPVDIVGTPEGTAAFVASAEANRPGLYALPSHKLLGRTTVKSWPACSLPARPGAMTLVVAPQRSDGDPDQGFCSGENFASSDAQKALRDPEHRNGNLALEQQKPGARKLVVSLPTEGELLIIDAQAVLDRAPGSFDTCPIERRIKLDSPLPDTVELPGTPPPGDECPARPPTTLAPFCPVRKPQTADYPADYTPFPVAFAQDDTALYIADEHAPLIHSYDLADPCAPVQLPPLLPSSFDQPWRPVATRSLAVSPTTTDGKRFLYAVDAFDGSAMVFDLTSGDRSPVVRSRPEYFPFSPRDRLNLGAPIRDLLFVQQDYYPHDLDGTKITGLRCDPTKPRGTDAPSSYQTLDDLSDGAAPTRLRGIFALAALTSGQVVFIDVDDYDAACRRARGSRGSGDLGATDLPDWVTGCDDVCTSRDATNACTACSSSTPSAPFASGEGSCRVVVRHEIRSNNYVLNSPTTGRNRPDIVTFPSLTLKGSALRTDVDSASDEARQNPKLLGPLNDSGHPDWSFTSDGTTVIGTGNPSPAAADLNFVVADIRDPRVAIGQDWSFTYEGVIPGTAGRIGRFVTDDQEDNPTEDNGRSFFYDLNGGFCYLGVQDEDLARLEGEKFFSREQAAELDQFAADHADWLEITNGLLDEEDPYWDDREKDNECSYLRCRATFGTPQAPTPARSFRIRKAFHDRVELVANKTLPGYADLLLPEPDPDPQKNKDNPQSRFLTNKPLEIPDPTGVAPTIDAQCCFPTQLTYQIRGGSTWMAVGSATGFLNRTTLGPDNRCTLLGVQTESINSSIKQPLTNGDTLDVPVTRLTGNLCDASFATRTGRAYEVPAPGGVRPIAGRSHDDPFTFHNPYFYALLYAGSQPSRRDMTFTWQMLGGFSPLEISTGRGSVQVAPQSMLYHPALGTEVLVTDAALQGVQTIDLFSFVVSRSFL